MATSSAEPEKLFHYSDVTLSLDSEVKSESARLRNDLAHFESGCREPGFRLSVVHHAGSMSNYGSQCETTDSWVRRVGSGFLAADSGGLWGSTEISWFGLPHSENVPGTAVPWLPWIIGIIITPPWLLPIVLVLPWIIAPKDPPATPRPQPLPTPAPTPTDTTKVAPTPIPEMVKMEPDIESARAQLATLSAMESPWKQVDAPIKSDLGSRSPQIYSAVIDQFDPEHRFAGRYRPGEATLNTRCNIFAADVMRAMGAPLPTKGDLGIGSGQSKDSDPMTVAFPPLYQWLNGQYTHPGTSEVLGGEKAGWHRLDPANPADLKVLYAHLEAGKPGVLADPGHIAVLRPEPLPSSQSPTDMSDFHIAQAGYNNYNDLALRDYTAYGSTFKPYIYIHD